MPYPPPEYLANLIQWLELPIWLGVLVCVYLTGDRLNGLWNDFREFRRECREDHEDYGDKLVGTMTRVSRAEGAMEQFRADRNADTFRDPIETPGRTERTGQRREQAAQDVRGRTESEPETGSARTDG